MFRKLTSLIIAVGVSWLAEFWSETYLRPLYPQLVTCVPSAIWYSDFVVGTECVVPISVLKCFAVYFECLFSLKRPE